MIYKLNLKNSKETVLVDEKVWEFLNSDPELLRIKFLENLREHSLGYAFYQKHWPQPDKSYKVQTIYIHKLIAETFIEKPVSEDRMFVLFKNGKTKDCRLENLGWVSRSRLVRNTKNINSKTGYRGVTKDGKRFRAIIYNNNYKIALGRFATPEEAALAYNEKAKELFGDDVRSLNKIPKEKLDAILAAKNS
jgi:hypothetical protein